MFRADLGYVVLVCIFIYAWIHTVHKDELAFPSRSSLVKEIHSRHQRTTFPQAYPQSAQGLEHSERLRRLLWRQEVATVSSMANQRWVLGSTQSRGTSRTSPLDS